MVKLHSPITQVDTTLPQYTVGSRTIDKDGNEYIYLPGIVSCIAYSVVTFITASGLSYGSVTLLATTGAVGPVGIAQGAITGPKYGWFQRKGVGWAASGGSITSGMQLYSSGTAGYAGGSVTSGDLIAGAFAVGTSSGSDGTVKVFLDNPFCTDTLS